MKGRMQRHSLSCVIRLLLSGFLVLAVSAAVVQARSGITANSEVTLLRNHEYGEALLKGMKNANRSIVFCFYLFKTGDNRGNMPRRIADELVAARRRGVDVTVYLEKNRNRKDSLNDENHRTAAYLQRGGVRVIFDSPNSTTHAKTVLIDSRYVFLGSHNLTQGALRHNNELSVVIDSPELAAVVKSYLDHL